MKIHHNLGACVAGMVHSFARAVRRRKKQWRESVVHEVLFGDLLFMFDYLSWSMNMPSLILSTTINILQIHQETVGQVNSWHVYSDQVTTDQQHPSTTILQHFICCGTSLITCNVWEFWSRTRLKYWIAIVEVAAAYSSHPKWGACPLSSARFLPRNVGSFTQCFDLDGTYRLKD